MRIIMNYGKKGLSLNLPDDWDVTVITKRKMPAVREPAEAVRFALSNPIGSKSLAEEAKGRTSACILICDITRPVPNSIILPVLIKELIAGGIYSDDIRVLVATGLHRPNEGKELSELIGNEWVLETVKVENHFARNDEDHVSLGTTSHGTPVKLDRRFVNADLRIVVGLVEPHFVAGYSGGRKVIAPGVCHHETITWFHSARFVEDPRADNCIIEGNPLHEDQLEIVGMTGDCLAINSVLDKSRCLSFVNFGEIVASHLDAISFVREHVEIPVSKRFKTVVTSAAGYPLDKTYYQTIKGIVGAKDVLQPGGNLFVVSECSEGMGSPEFVASQDRLIKLGVEGFLKGILSKCYAAIDEWNTELLLKTMRVGNVHIYTEGLSESELTLTGVHVVGPLDEAVRESVENANDRSVAVIPEGPYDIPFYGPSSRV